MKNRNFQFPVSVCWAMLITLSISAQNVGINTSNPTEPLEVGGIIYSNADGFKFPDGSVQTRALNSFPASDASDLRGFIIMDIDGIPGPFSYGVYADVVKVLEFSWGASIGSAGPPEFEDITVLKEIDRTTVPLLEKFFTAVIIPDVDFYMFQYDTVQQIWDDYYHIQILAARVTSVNQFTEYAGNEDYRHLETITFIFEQIIFEYDFEVSQQYQYTVITDN